MSGEKKEHSGKTGSLIAGVLLGMILGLAAAAGVAWYVIKKNPSSFENKDHSEAPKPELASTAPPTLVPPIAAVSAPVASPASAPIVASAVSDAPQHFEFYKVLTDKPDGGAAKSTGKSSSPVKAAQATPAEPAKPAQEQEKTKEVYYVQAGSFPNEIDGENLKAKLALMGLEASLQTAVIPDRGTFHRVRLGPYDTSAEMNKVLTLLKQNGVAGAAPIKVQ